jgi:hypothetical protein
VYGDDDSLLTGGIVFFLVAASLPDREGSFSFLFILAYFKCILVATNSPLGVIFFKFDAVKYTQGVL